MLSSGARSVSRITSVDTTRILGKAAFVASGDDITLRQRSGGDDVSSSSGFAVKRIVAWTKNRRSVGQDCSYGFFQRGVVDVICQGDILVDQTDSTDEDALAVACRAGFLPERSSGSSA